MSHQTLRGKLKIYLGYAAGVGKTYRMLEDAKELKARGVDVVLAFLEPQGRSDLIELAKEFETISLLRVACRGSFLEELDIAGILQRSPHVCIIDDLAHTNAPGSERPRRWKTFKYFSIMGSFGTFIGSKLRQEFMKDFVRILLDHDHAMAVGV
jgi:two-component system, OmpR family, sensor histidine kinase KdpD